MRQKHLGKFALTMAFSLGMTMCAYAGSWQWIDNNADGIAECYYINDDTSMAKNTEVEGYTLSPEGLWHVDGVIQKKPTAELNAGWYMNCGFWRYSSDKVDLANTWKKIDGATYYFDMNGNMVTGFQEIDGELYYFNESGALQRKTFRLDDVYYVIEDSDGAIGEQVDREDWSSYKKENGIKGSVTNFDAKPQGDAVAAGGASDGSGSVTDGGGSTSDAGSSQEAGTQEGSSQETGSQAGGSSSKGGPASDKSLQELAKDQYSKPEVEVKEEEKQQPPEGYGWDRIPEELRKSMEAGRDNE